MVIWEVQPVLEMSLKNYQCQTWCRIPPKIEISKGLKHIISNKNKWINHLTKWTSQRSPKCLQEFLQHQECRNNRECKVLRKEFHQIWVYSLKTIWILNTTTIFNHNYKTEGQISLTNNKILWIMAHLCLILMHLTDNMLRMVNRKCLIKPLASIKCHQTHLDKEICMEIKSQCNKTTFYKMIQTQSLECHLMEHLICHNPMIHQWGQLDQHNLQLQGKITTQILNSLVLYNLQDHPEDKISFLLLWELTSRNHHKGWPQTQRWEICKTQWMRILHNQFSNKIMVIMKK